MLGVVRSAELPVLDLYPFASTSPIYVTVVRRCVRSEAGRRVFLGWLDRVDQALGSQTGVEHAGRA